MIETGENQVRLWKGAAGHPLKVSLNLVELAMNKTIEIKKILLLLLEN